MKLADLISALADEIELMQPQLSKTLDQLCELSVEDEQFMVLLEQYNESAVRMGEAAHMVGFTGLQQICEKVLENTLLLTVFEGEEKSKLIALLNGWPTLVSHYLNNLEDPSIAAGLVDLFIEAPAPFTEEEALKVMHQLGAMALKATEGVKFHDPENERATTAFADDVNIELSEDINEQLLESFLQESPDIAFSLVEWAKELVNTGNIDVNEIQAAKRYTHTLKGTGATVGIRGLASIGHHLEDILEYLEANPTKSNDGLNNLILDASYCLQQMVGYIAGDDDAPEQSLLVLQQILDIANKIDNHEPLTVTQPTARHSSGLTSDLVTTEATVDETNVNEENANQEGTNLTSTFEPPNSYDADSSKNNAQTTLTPEQKNQQTSTANSQSKNNKKTNKVKSQSLRIAVEKVDELFRMSGEISIHSSAMEDRIKFLTDQASKLLEQNIRLQKRLLELETIVDVRALSLMRGRMNTDDDKKDFDPLEMDQYNELHSSAHALIEEAADARAIAHQVEEQIASLTSMQTRQKVLSRDLQHLVIGTRMSEVGSLETRLQRNVRTTCQMTGKQVNLHITGQETLIDSDVINHLAEPLLHLLRNAVDHGIETPEQRVAKGKDKTGNIYLDFLRQGQQVILRCHDDGQGLHIEKIKQRALSHGLMSENQQLSDFEVSQLIFASGFSSRDSVSEISGRGVGLDVVKQWANNMNGSIHISQSEWGGCLFELRFSASLSTIQSLIVKVDEAFFAIPAVQIDQAIAKNVGRYGYENKKFVYYYDDTIIPARLLANMVGLPVEETEDFADYETILVSIHNQQYAIAVTKLFDSRELLVKPPGRYARHLPSVSGLSILGNGAIAVNLDLSQIISTTQIAVKKKSVTSIKNVPKVLIVDDALTVRNSLQQLISDIGFDAFTARDGIEAVNILKETTPDVVLTDLEMPNMNGIELTKYIRNNDSELPVIMITSRSQDKHRDLADNAGVNQYITKPYRDVELVNSIRMFLN